MCSAFWSGADLRCRRVEWIRILTAFGAAERRAADLANPGPAYACGLDESEREAGEGAPSGLAGRLRRRDEQAARLAAPGRVWLCIAGWPGDRVAWARAIADFPATGVPAPAALAGGGRGDGRRFAADGDVPGEGRHGDARPGGDPTGGGRGLSHPVGSAAGDGVGPVVVSVVKRRPPSKAIFNVLSLSAAAVAALACYQWVLGGSSPVSLRGWVACAAAVVAADLVTNVAVTAVVAVSARRWPWTESLTTLRASATSVPVRWSWR